MNLNRAVFVSICLCIMCLSALQAADLTQAEKWVYRYNGPGNGLDQATALACGSDGNVYVAGQSKGDGTALDFTVISLTPAGESAWVYRYDGPASKKDFASSISCAPDGNVYSAGASRSDNGEYTVCAVSLDPQGEERWVYRYNDEGGYTDVKGYAITNDPDGNLYVGGWGTSVDSDIGNDVVVVSLTSSGDERWTYQSNRPSDDEIERLVCGTDGNIYVCGNAMNENGYPDLLVMSLDGEGQERWSYTYEGTGRGTDKGYGITVGLDGNIYVTGYSMGTMMADEDVIVISLTSSGDERWVHRYDGPSHGGDACYSIVYGPDDYLYVAGEAKVGDTYYDSDYLVMSLDTEGNSRWNYFYNGPKNYQDDAYDIIYGSDGNLYISGYSSGTDTGHDYTVVSLNTEGEERWVYRYNGPANSKDELWPIVYGEDGSVYAAGISKGDGTREDMAIISLDKDFIMPQSESPLMTSYGNGRKIVRVGDTVWAVCQVDGEIYALKSVEDGETWSEKFLVSEGQSDCRVPAIASDGMNPHIVWKNKDGIFWSAFDGSFWTEPTKLRMNVPPLPVIYGPLSFEISGQQGFILTKMSRGIIPGADFGAPPITGKIILGTWDISRPSTVGVTLIANQVMDANPSLAILDGVHIVYSKDGEIWYRKDEDTAVNISNSPDIPSRNPSISVGESLPGSGEYLIHIVWEERFPNAEGGTLAEVFYAYKDLDGEIWSEPWNISNSADSDSHYPQFICGDGFSAILWESLEPDGQWETLFAIEDGGGWSSSGITGDARYPHGIAFEITRDLYEFVALMTKGDRAPYSLCSMAATLQ